MKNRSQSHDRMRSSWILRWSQYGLFLLGVLALGCYGIITIYVYRHQSYLQQSFEQALKKYGSTLIQPPVGLSQLRPVVHEGSLLGRLEVPRIGLSVMVLEGVDAHTLRLGAGHIPGTAFPSESGNVGIAAHRDSFFRGLQNIRKMDRIQLTTTDGSYPYRVEAMKIVDPGDVDVLNPSQQPTLTLVTCYPFHFVGPAPKRFIIHAIKEGGINFSYRVKRGSPIEWEPQSRAGSKNVHHFNYR